MHDGLGPMDVSDQQEARDPVCGMRVNPAQPKGGSHVHDGQTYYFCNPKCRDKFSASPQTYLSQPPPQPRPAPPAAPPGTIYTCPMDPEVRQVGPGSCPVCGMALEPLTIGAEEEANPELVDMTRRFWVGSPSRCRCSSWRWPKWYRAWICITDSVAGVAVAPGAAGHAGRVVGRLAVLPARLGCRSSPDGSTCSRSIAIGTGVAYAYSVVATAGAGLLPGLVPRPRRRPSPVYFEAAAVIVTLVLLGQVLELRARAGPAGAIRALLGAGAEDRAARARRRDARKTCRSTTCSPATACACAPARRFRSTAALSRDELRRRVDGDRRADAGRRRRPAIASPAGR